MLSYFNGHFTPRESVCLSPDDRGWLFADGVYEVIRAYRGRPLAVEAHARRLAASLDAVRIAWPELGRLPWIVEELLRRNSLAAADALVYVQVTRGVAPRAHVFPDPAAPPTVYASASPYEPAQDLREGVEAILVPDTRWARCDIKSVGLLPNVLALQRALECGAAEAVFVRDGALTEGTHTNVCAVIGGQLLTPPLTNYVLPGVTRALVLELCDELRIPWRTRALLDDDVGRFDELLLVGTTVEVAPVVRISGEVIGDGRPGPITRQLLDAYRSFAEA